MSELFGPTSWSSIRRAAHGEGREQDHALNRLATAYRPPLLALARYTGIPDNDAEDLVQTVLAKAFAPDALAKLNRTKGRFSGWLAALLDNEWKSLLRRQHRQCRDARATCRLNEAGHLPANVGDVAAFIDMEFAVQCLESVRLELIDEWGDEEDAMRLWCDLFHQNSGKAFPKNDAYYQRKAVFKRKFAERLKRRVRKSINDPMNLDIECHDLLLLALRANPAP
jgi:DNA-directed RNA polymerase specialized sigma24 family protein